MKKSNIILSAFAVFIVGSTLLLFIDGKKHKNEVNDKGFKEITYRHTPDFKVIVTEEDADVHIDFSDTVQLGVEFLEHKKDFSIFHTNGDTLFIKGGLRTFVKCPKLSKLECRNSKWVGVSVYNTDTVCVNIRGGEARFYTADNIDEQKGIGQIEKPVMILNACDHADVDLFKLLTSLKINATSNSHIANRLAVKTIEARLQHNSELISFKAPTQLSAQRDSTSSIKVY